ncbi:hypothetical protein RND81_02G037400 [Saponaria officinalis]|uniref:Expansin n=1 Tax=Saponaria officinalis TaxID=3572 RepID=A0AAW1MQ64_SAPOF
MANPKCKTNCASLMMSFFLIVEVSMEKYISHGWDFARATFYGNMAGNETMYGACGYENLIDQGYGLETAALSTALFNDGLACGSCYEIMCVNSPWCIKGGGPIRVTATNFCPPWYKEAPDAWCNPPRKHFDLSQKMFVEIAEYRGGVVPVIYRKVMCYKKGGIKFELKGNPYWLLVLVFNVNGAGNVVAVDIKGSNTDWTQMTRNWGQNWQTFERLQGQRLSFRVTTSDGRQKQFMDVAPENWELGQTHEAKGNMIP